MIQGHLTWDEIDNARLLAMLNDLANEAGFSEQEWSCLADLTNGTYLYDATTLRHLHLEIESAEAAHFEKWEVRRGDIASKLAGLDSLSRLAVAFRCLSLFEE